jgi:GT2 family glycosyltransferase
MTNRRSVLPVVTIAVLSYNNRDIIDDCFKAIAKLAYPAVECLLIDDCSTDSTVKHVTKVYPWVTVIRKPVNSGIGTSRNLAIKHASGAYILFHDSDARLYPDYLHSSIELLEHNPDIAIVASKLLSLNDPALLDQAGGGYSKFGYGIDRGKGQSASLFNEQEDVFFAGGAAQLVRMSLFTAIGDYDATTGTFGCEDVDISWRARLAGFRVVYNPKSIGQHGFHTTVKKMPSSQVLFHSQKAHARMLIKNFGLLNLLTFLPLVFVFSTGDIVLFPEGRLAKTRAWLWNARHIKDTLLERKKIQRMRILKDKDIEPYFEHDMRNVALKKLRTFYGGRRS